VLANQRRRQPASGFDLTRLDGLDNHAAGQLSISEVLGRIANSCRRAELSAKVTRFPSLFRPPGPIRHER
jgi:hypothetical protein